MISFGIDIGTTTIRAAVVKIELAPFGKKVFSGMGQPLCAFTPFMGGCLNEPAILSLLEKWIEDNGFPPPEIGTLLFTGEAQRASNSFTVSSALSSRWGGLLTAQLNPELETVVAAHGAGAVELSERLLGKPVLHIDVGGGTSNLAWIENGIIVDTACLDLGSRKWILGADNGRIESRTAQAEWLERLYPDILQRRNRFDGAAGGAFARVIAELILCPSEVTREFAVVPWKTPRDFSERPVLSLSGGVVDCLNHMPADPFAFGDLGPLLGVAIREVAGRNGQKLHLSSHEGRATALGISSYGFEVSGNSIHATDGESLMSIPLFRESELEAISEIPPSFAVELRVEAIREMGIDACARLWANRLSGPGLVDGVVFLLKDNLAKTFGYYLQKSLGPRSLRFKVLDEITPLPAGSTVPVRTVDIRKESGGDRYTVTIKEIRLF